MTCSSGLDDCGKAFLSGKDGGTSVEVYVKNCAASSACNPDASALCKHSDPSITECDIYCCSGDLCNGATVPVVSAIMLTACAFVAFLY